MAPWPNPLRLFTGGRRPLLSVCLPAYNGVATIGETLGGVLDQKGVELEVVVGDDASADGTVNAVKALGDRRIRLYAYPERLGIVSNWNRTLTAARGKYVILMGQDDLVEPGWAEALVSLLEEDDRAGMSFCRRRFSYDGPESEAAVGDFFSRRYPAMLATFYANTGRIIAPEVMVREAMRQDFEINLIGEPAFVAFRREHPAARQGYDPAMYQMIDWEFYTRFIAEGPILHCPRVLGTYRIRSVGVSVDNARNLHRHAREYDHLLGLVLARFDRFLDRAQREILVSRRREARSRLAGPPAP